MPSIITYYYVIFECQDLLLSVITRNGIYTKKKLKTSENVGLVVDCSFPNRKIFGSIPTSCIFHYFLFLPVITSEISFINESTNLGV